jgi:YegS/Rv2252/BmrU family lipid kinase
MKKLLYLINPAAGKGGTKNRLYDIVHIFNGADYEVTVYISKSLDDYLDRVRRSEGEYDVVVVSGGDGTLNLTAGVVSTLKAPPLIGYIPAGTANDFAASHGISTNPVQAAHQIANGKERHMDLGFFCDRSFVYVTAFGVFTDVSYQTPREMKQNLGHAAYVLEGIKSLSKITPVHMKFRYNGVEDEGDFIYGMMTNTVRVGGFKLPLIKDAIYDDGLMEVTLVRHSANFTDSSKLLNALVTQTADDDVLKHFQTDRIEFESVSPVPWTVDGEFGGERTEGVIRIEKTILGMIY